MTSIAIKDNIYQIKIITKMKKQIDKGKLQELNLCIYALANKQPTTSTSHSSI